MKITTQQPNPGSNLRAKRSLKRYSLTQKRTSGRASQAIIKPFTIYASSFVLLMSVVAVGYHRPDKDVKANVLEPQQSQRLSTTDIIAVDEKIATDVAANFALQTDMPVASNVANLSTSLEAKQEIAQTNDMVISKPQIVQPTADSRTITSYKAKSGDSVQSVAEQFSLSPQTIKWANNLTSDALEKDRNLVVPPVDGVVYTTKEGDTPQAIAEKYKGSAEHIIVFNDLEEGVIADTRIVIPNGVLPEDQRPGYEEPSRTPATSYQDRGTTGQSTSVRPSAMANASAGNAYALGNCTWYAYERRAELGRPIGSFWGNASTWGINGGAAGFKVNGTPAPGAIMQNGGGYAGYGHVAIVESINPDGSITVSEMNYAGFNVVSNRTVPASDFSKYSFIH